MFKKIKKYKSARIGFSIIFIAFTFILFFNNFSEKKENLKVSKEEQQKAQKKVDEINQKIKKIKLDRLAKKFGISKLHDKYNIADYYLTSLPKDTVFKSKDKAYLLKKGTNLKVVVMEDGKEHYIYKNLILNKIEKGERNETD